MNRKRWIALLLALACLLLAGCQKQSAEDLQTPDDESDVVGDDWRTWGWINDWGTIVVDGEMIDVLLCVVPRLEVPRLKRIIVECDDKAFVIATDVREALGEGFTPHK